MNLKAKVGLDTTGFDAGLKRMKTRAGTFMAQTTSKATSKVSKAGIFGMLAAIPFVGAAIKGAADKAIPTEEAGRIRDESKKIGVSTDTFQKLDYAARQSGASIVDVGKAFKALAIRQQDAAKGNKEYMEAFARYGISVDELKAKSPEAMFERISREVEKGTNKANELADMQRLLGKSGTELLPTMQAGLGAAIKEATEIGVPMSPALIKRYSTMGDQLTKLGQGGMRLVYGVRGAVDRRALTTHRAVDLMSKMMDGVTREHNRKKEIAALETIASNTGVLKQ